MPYTAYLPNAVIIHHSRKQFGEEQAYFSLCHERKSAKGTEGMSSTVRSEGGAIEKSHLVDCLLWLCVFFLHNPKPNTGSGILPFSYQSRIKEVPQGIPKGQPDEIAEVPSLQMTLVVSRNKNKTNTIQTIFPSPLYTKNVPSMSKKTVC